MNRMLLRGVAALRIGWPWLFLAAIVGLAAWCLVSFESDFDPEFPTIVRPTFSPWPPRAYRLAEPGDTLDRVGLYAAAFGISIAGLGSLARRRRGGGPSLWPAALALSLLAYWHEATPAPSPTGWHGLGWGIVLDPSAPFAWRLAAGLIGLTLVGVVVTGLLRIRSDWRTWRARAAEHQIVGLLATALVLVVLHLFDLPRIGPPGYGPRSGLSLGLLAWSFALVRCLPPARKSSVGWIGAAVVLSAALIWTGRGLIWFHQPIERLKESVPGRVFISAMPTERGLELAQNRHHFRTIINLFPEDTPLRSPHYPDELRFAAEHGLTYLVSPTDPADADAFLERTFELAKNPNAWPILIHCHACMDRTPAWLGLYRFLIEGRPLLDVMREIEQHRGLRPKGSVTVMYAYHLSRLAPERAEADPTFQVLKQSAAAIPPLDREPRATISHLADDTARRP